MHKVSFAKAGGVREKEMERCAATRCCCSACVHAYLCTLGAAAALKEAQKLFSKCVTQLVCVKQQELSGFTFAERVRRCEIKY
jgi:hypothetical protein